MSIWLFAPVLAFFWLYMGWPFWKSFLAFFLVSVILSAFRYSGPLEGLWVTIIVVSSLWVYGNAKRNRVKFGWAFAVGTFVFPIIGLPIYLIFLRSTKSLRMETIEGDEAKMEMYK